MSANLRGALAAVFYLIALGIAGTDDYAEAVRHEKINCDRHPAAEWCQK